MVLHHNSIRDIDRIGYLPDDLLHLILSYASDDAAEVTRTSVLSRRWRRVWIHAQKLCFDDRQSRRRLANFGGFVDWAFAQRGDTDVNEWLRYATQRVVKTFWLNACDSTPNGAWWSKAKTDHGHLPTVELPSHRRTASIILNLSSYPFRLKLPASPAARYEALTYLSLSSAWFGEDEAVADRRTLTDFISSCCPRLRKLKIIDPMRLPRLVLRAEALEELVIASTRDMQTMDVTAPNLRIFELHYFKGMTSVTNYWESIDLVVRIAAPKLEEIAINNSTLEIEDNLDLRIHGLESVRRLSNLTLAMHGHYCCNTVYGLWLLNNCPNVEHIDLNLGHRRHEMRATHEFDDLTDNGAPRLHKARSMVVRASRLKDQYLVTSVWSLLLMCPGLISLRIDLEGWGDRSSRDQDTRKDRNISLEFQEEVKLTSFTGRDGEMDLVSLLFGSSSSIKSMTISTPEKEISDTCSESFLLDSDDDYPHYHRLLKIAPLTDHGRWHYKRFLYTWTRYATEDARATVSRAPDAKAKAEAGDFG
uniref:F-box domain-containing protein n=1 Tax=Oryza punctata TaxID=4537 RepID=A0A0E0KAN9_ORYPU